MPGRVSWAAAGLPAAGSSRMPGTIPSATSAPRTWFANLIPPSSDVERQSPAAASTRSGPPATAARPCRNLVVVAGCVVNQHLRAPQEPYQGALPPRRRGQVPQLVVGQVVDRGLAARGRNRESQRPPGVTQWYRPDDEVRGPVLARRDPGHLDAIGDAGVLRRPYRGRHLPDPHASSRFAGRRDGAPPGRAG